MTPCSRVLLSAIASFVCVTASESPFTPNERQLTLLSTPLVLVDPRQAPVRSGDEGGKGRCRLGIPTPIAPYPNNTLITEHYFWAPLFLTQ